jgi:hypothetical protein
MAAEEMLHFNATARKIDYFGQKESMQFDFVEKEAAS